MVPYANVSPLWDVSLFTPEGGSPECSGISCLGLGRGVEMAVASLVSLAAQALERDGDIAR